MCVIHADPACTAPARLADRHWAQEWVIALLASQWPTTTSIRDGNVTWLLLIDCTVTCPPPPSPPPPQPPEWGGGGKKLWLDSSTCGDFCLKCGDCCGCCRFVVNCRPSEQWPPGRNVGNESEGGWVAVPASTCSKGFHLEDGRKCLETRNSVYWISQRVDVPPQPPTPHTHTHTHAQG